MNIFHFFQIILAILIYINYKFTKLEFKKMAIRKGKKNMDLNETKQNKDDYNKRGNSIFIYLFLININIINIFKLRLLILNQNTIKLNK